MTMASRTTMIRARDAEGMMGTGKGSMGRTAVGAMGTGNTTRTGTISRDIMMATTLNDSRTMTRCGEAARN